MQNYGNGQGKAEAGRMAIPGRNRTAMPTVLCLVYCGTRRKYKKNEMNDFLGRQGELIVLGCSAFDAHLHSKAASGFKEALVRYLRDQEKRF